MTLYGAPPFLCPLLLGERSTLRLDVPLETIDFCYSLVVSKVTASGV